ncbi:MAG TPA: helix-turn-helix transcriptional regulator [Waterburya sp.]|jgi:DNA-binding transcriptional regulator YiaG
MQPTTNAVPLKQASSLKQPLFGCLVRELRGLTKLTQGQFAAAIGVNYVTISRWETGRIQPSELALRQVQSFIEKLSRSAAQPIQDRSKELLAEYFAETQE